MQSPYQDPRIPHIRGIRGDDLFLTLSKEIETQEAMSKSERIYLYALVDQGRFTDSSRAIFRLASIGLEASPLLDDPKYKSLLPHCAVLVHPADAPSVPLAKYLEQLEPLFKYDSDIISGWITSHLEPALLAQHFQHAAFGYHADQSAYFLAYYDPRAVPILRKLAPPEWSRWFLGPVISWWYPNDAPTEETWDRIEGYRQEEPQAPQRLVFSEELWDALSGDPFPYQLLVFAEQKLPSSVFGSNCSGVRLAKIEQMLETGKKCGLKEKNDLITYVLSLLDDPTLPEKPRWKDAMDLAARRKLPLDAYYA